MRVLYFTAGDSPHDSRFLSALAGTAHQVFSLRMYACDPHTPVGITELDWPAGQPDWANWAGWQAGTAQFDRLLSNLQPDLIHAGPIQEPGLVAALVDFHPLVSMSWGFDLLRTARRSPWMEMATTCTLEHSDVLVADCQTVADEAACYGFPPERMVLFPWGVDLAHFSPETARKRSPEIRQALGWEDSFVIFCNRSWSPRYGVNLLAQAFVNAFHKRSDLRLLLAGDGPQSDLIRGILAPVADAVHFAGWVDRDALPAYYGAGDLFVSPSHCDGSSVSLLEALACRRPVLVSDIPSNQEWVRPGGVGDVFTDGCVTSLEDRLLALASSPDLSAYGWRARQLALARADWDSNFQKLEHAYQMASP